MHNKFIDLLALRYYFDHVHGKRSYVNSYLPFVNDYIIHIL